ncbi:MAG: PucR family transcriptional regulator ligand-binding domain-containing protein [Lachnospiraceae bacterium]|jgi:DNA-binding PucR family transcriptional regulator|nr:PucR family transcriptional regulator ligand-binding domain-containing protein [Lachnospiraceae bacterium]
MGFTIEDMMTVSGARYKIKMEAGKHGWSNSISWILMIEDMTILQNFAGKDLAVTTGLGFRQPRQQLELVKELSHLGASGLIINTGMYIMEIPQKVRTFCDDNDFPLMTVPWDIPLFDMIKDLNMRILLQGITDDEISDALIQAIKAPGDTESSRKRLLPHFDVDGTFQVVLIEPGNLDTMDTVERRRISFQLQIYLESISHNASFFYYDAAFALVVNDVPEDHLRDLLDRFVKRLEVRMPDRKIWVGIGSPMEDLKNLHLAYRRAQAAVRMAAKQDKNMVWFDEMGIYKMLSLIPDPLLRKEMGEDLLMPLLAHDKAHGTDYVEMLEIYLETGGSIKAVAEQTFTHRNTAIYRLGNIRKLLGNDLESPEDRLRYQIACMLLHTPEPIDIT